MPTATKIGEPARVGQWGLTFNSMELPTEAVVINYEQQSRRHSEPCTVVHRLPYDSTPAALVDELVETVGIPSGTARLLVTELLAKGTSAKVAGADKGYRPVR